MKSVAVCSLLCIILVSPLPVLPSVKDRLLDLTAVATPVPGSDRAYMAAQNALPLIFEPNVGQAPSDAKYVARARGYAAHIGSRSVTVSRGGSRRLKQTTTELQTKTAPEISSETMQMTFVGASIPTIEPERRLESYSNYFVGTQEKWRSRVPHYAELVMRRVWRGVDVRLRGSSDLLEFDFELESAADPATIAIKFDGCRQIERTASGELRLRTTQGELLVERAIAYQTNGMSKSSVDADYEVRGDGTIGFRLGQHDEGRPVTIDPVIRFVNSIGGSSADDEATAVCVDGSGAAYVAGVTQANDFPVTPGALISERPGSASDPTWFISKFAPGGASLVYSTYFPEFATIDSIAVDGTGALFTTGRASTNFPVTPGAYNTTGGSRYVAKLNSSGTAFEFATYIGGPFGLTVGATSIAVDAAGSAHLAGATFCFDETIWPTTPGAYDTEYESGVKPFLTKFTPDGSDLVFSTFLGGLSSSFGAKYFVSIDPVGRAVVAGTTDAIDFPATPGAYDTVRDGPVDGFLMKLESDGSDLVWATLLGGADSDEISGLGLSSTGTPVVSTATLSSDFPISPGAFDATPDVTAKSLAITRLSADGTSLLYSTYLGEGVNESSIAVNANGTCVVTGITYSTVFPTTPGSFMPAPPTESPAWSFVSRVSVNGSSLEYSSYVGPATESATHSNYEGERELVDVDSSGSAYIVGGTIDLRFPSVNGPVPPPDRANAFLMKVAPAGSSISYSVRFGGSVSPGSNLEYGDDIAADVSIAPDGGPVLVGATRSLNFPTLPGSWDTTFNGTDTNAFVTKFNAAGSALVFSTFLGGSALTSALGVDTDAAGSVYVCGVTNANDFPVTPGAADSSHIGGDSEGFFAKLNASGGALIFATYVGGSGNDLVSRIAVDAGGAATVAGTTSSADFPATVGALDVTLGGASDAFVARISAIGSSFVFASYLGGAGDEEGADIAIDGAGQSTVVGRTTSSAFPTTIGAFDVTYGGTGFGLGDGFVTRLTSSGSSLVYSTYLGGSHDDSAAAVAVDVAGAAHVTGSTRSINFPVTPGAFDETYNADPSGGRYDAFATKLTPSGSSLAYSTYLGTGGSNFDPGDEAGIDIGIDSAGQACLIGLTSSSNYPITPNAFDPVYGGLGDCFVTTLNSGGSALVMSSYLGGGSGDNPKAIALDASGSIYIVGGTYSRDFSSRSFGPMHPASYSQAAFLAVVGSPSGTADISVTNAESADPILTGTSLTYNLSVHNAGPDPALGTSVSLPIGSGMTFASCTVSQGTFNVPPVGQTGTVVASFGTVAVGQTATVAVVVNVVAQSGATLVTTATASTLSADSAPANNIATETTGVIATPFAGSDTIGVIVGSTGAFFLKNTNAPGTADTVFTYGAGNPAWAALRGDWDGDGDDSVGLYDPATGAFFLRNTNAPGGADIVFTYGAGGLGLVPITGDWDGNGTDSIGLYAPSTGAFFLRNSNTPGGADIVLTFGAGGAGIVPLAGDWDGDGDDTIGLYLSASATFFLKNANAPGPADSAFSYGPAGLVPLAGDWDNNGFDTIGVFHPSSTAWFLRNSNTPGPADLVFTYGPAGAGALVGDWDGQ